MAEIQPKIDDFIIGGMNTNDSKGVSRFKFFSKIVFDRILRNMGNYDKMIFLDTEFIGDGPITNQVVEIGWSLFHNNGVKLDSGKIGPIRIGSDRKWNPKCKEWWHSIPQMKQFANLLDHDTATATQLATEEEIKKCIAIANANTNTSINVTSDHPIENKLKPTFTIAPSGAVCTTIDVRYKMVEKDGVKTVVEVPYLSSQVEDGKSASSKMGFVATTKYLEHSDRPTYYYRSQGIQSTCPPLECRVPITFNPDTNTISPAVGVHYQVVEKDGVKIVGELVSLPTPPSEGENKTVEYYKTSSVSVDAYTGLVSEDKRHYAVIEKNGVKTVVEVAYPRSNKPSATSYPSATSVMLSEKQAISAFVDAVRELQTYYKFEEGKSRWAFATDTVSNDCTHLNAMLNRHGHPSLTNFFNDSYNDVVCTKSAQTLALGCGLTKEKREWRKVNDPNFPKNLNAHDAQSDAIFIGESYFYYLRAAAEEQVEKEIRFAKIAKSNRRMRKYVAVCTGVTIAAVVTGAVAIFMGVLPSRIPQKSSATAPTVPSVCIRSSAQVAESYKRLEAESVESYKEKYAASAASYK